MSSAPSNDPRPRKSAQTMSLEELDALYGDVEPPDRTPLTAEEMAALRARLDSRRPGEKLHLTYRERAARWELGIIRPTETVVDLYTQVQQEYRTERMSPSSTEMGQGVIDAIEWCTGAREQAPITGAAPETFPPPTGQMSAEEEAAGDVARGRRQHARGRSYAVGVEHTIMWLLARTTQRPWGSINE